MAIGSISINNSSPVTKPRDTVDYHENNEITVKDTLVENNIALHKNVLEKMASFGKNWSLVEIATATVGFLTSKFRADWAVYGADSVFELAINNIYLEKQLPKPLERLLIFAANKLGVKDTNGQTLKIDNIANNRELVIGTMMRLVGYLSGAFSIFKPLTSFLLGGDKEKISRFNFWFNIIAPIINGSGMLYSTCGKFASALVIKYLSNGSFSTMEKKVGEAIATAKGDKLCSLESLSVLLVSLAKKISAFWGDVAEAAVGLYLSSKMTHNGHHAIEESQGRHPQKITNSEMALMKWLSWPFAKINHFFGIKGIPRLDRLVNIVQSSSPQNIKEMILEESQKFA